MDPFDAHSLLSIYIALGCGGRMQATNTTASMKSPNFPLNYPNNLKCELTIVGGDEQVEVVFTYVKLEEKYDTLTICDGSYCNETNTIATLTGDLSNI